MFRSTMMRGASASALTVILFPCLSCSVALAQEALPTIDIAAERPRAAAGGKAALDAKSGDRITGYRADKAVSATKTNAPIITTPVSVQTITREIMDDQQAISVQDAIIGNVSGVVRAPGSYGDAFPSFNIRGFTSGSVNTGSTYYNGLRTTPNNGTELANVQSFEVVKGPSSVLYGRMEPGGMIAIQSKRPRETPYYSFQTQAGKFGTYRATADVTGPVTADKSLLYRVNADVSYDNGFVDFVYAKNVFVAPAVTYHPTEQISFFIEAQYQKAQNVLTQSQNIVLDTMSSPASIVPYYRFIGNPSIAHDHPNTLENRQLFYEAKLQFDPDWSLVHRGLYSNQSWFLSTTQGQPLFRPILVNGQLILTNFGGTPDSADVNMASSWGSFRRELFAFNVDLAGKVDTGPIHHDLLLGVDYNHQESSNSSQGTAFGGRLNVYSPDYLAYPFSFSSPGTLFFAGYSRSERLWRAVYGQNMISALDDRLHVLLGGRYDWASTSNGSGDTYEAAVPFTTTHDRAFSPRVGVLYRLFPWFSVYGSYVESFGQSNGVNAADQRALPPQKGKQWEGGVKAELFEGRLAISAAYYDIWKSNIPYADATNPLNTLLIGLAESKGVELDVIGKIDDNWSVIANYAHQDTRVVNGQATNRLDPSNQVREVAQTGRWLPSVPANMGNIWLKYTADGDWLGLSLFGGVQIVGSSFGDNANSFKIDQYTLVNGGASYSFLWEDAKMTAQVNVTNLNDARYYVSAANRYTIISGAPRAVLGSLRLEF